MDHTSNCRPIVGMAAVMTAGAVLLAPTTPLPPKPPVTLSAPQISTQAVHLAALPSPLDITPGTAAAASASSVGLGNILDRVLTGISTGAGAGALLGFVIGGALALNTFGRIPVVGQFLTPVIQAAAIVGAIVGIPIGAVAGLIGAIRGPSPSAGSQSVSAASIRSAAAINKAAVASTHRSAKRVLRSERHDSPAPAPSRSAASQQSSGSKDTGAGHARPTTPRNVNQH